MGGRGASSSLATIIKKAKENPQGYKEIATLDKNKIGIKTSSDKIVLTNERKKHIYDEHKVDFDRIMRGIKPTLERPNTIRQDKKHSNTIYYIRKTKRDNQNVVVSLNTSNSKEHPENSIITSHIVSDRNLKRLLKKSTEIYNNGKK